MSNLLPRQEIPSLSTTATLTTQNTTVTQNNNFTQNNDTIYNQLSAPAAQQSQAQAANGDSLPHCLSSGQSSIRRRAEVRRLPLQWSSDDEFDRSLGPGEISTDDESEAYASNRKNPEIKNCTKIHLEKYDPDNKEEDFSIWISQFEEAINQRLNPHSQRRHYIACKRWLPSLLKTDAYSVWSRAEYKDSDWPLLKQELAAAFEDSSVRAEWRTSLKAYMWDKRNQTLQSYCAKVKHLVDTFETEMVGFPKAIKAQYFLRFINGLPDDYAQHIKLSLPPNSTDIDKAMDVCTQWQLCKSLRNNSELGASAAFQDPKTSKLTRNKTNLNRLDNEMQQLKENQSDKFEPLSNGITPYTDQSLRHQPNPSSWPSNPAEEAASSTSPADDTIDKYLLLKQLEEEEKFVRFCKFRDRQREESQSTPRW